MARASGRRTRRGRAGRDAGCARRTGRAGTAARRCRPGPRAASSTSSPNAHARRERVAEPAQAARRPRASPTSCASGRAPRGRRRGPGPPARTAGVGRREDDARRARATAPRARARRRRRRPRWPPGRRRPPRPASRRAGRSPRPRPRTTAPVTAGPSNVGGIHAGSMPSAVEHLRRPVARGEVEQQRAGAIGLVHRVLAGQPEPHVVLGQQHVGDARPDVRLVVADPDQLGRGEPGQRVVAGDLDQPLGPTAARISSHSAAVRWSFHRIAGRRTCVGRVEQHERRASGRSARPPSTSSPSTPAAASAAPDRGRRAPSHHSVRVLLAPQRVRLSKPYSAVPIAGDRARLVDEDRLGRRRRDVDPEDERHPVRPGPPGLDRPDRAG